MGIRASFSKKAKFDRLSTIIYYYYYYYYYINELNLHDLDCYHGYRRDHDNPQCAHVNRSLLTLLCLEK